MIDSHAHLIWDVYDSDRDDIISRAKDIGITAIVHPCVELVDLPQMESLQKQYGDDYIYIAAGVHPCHADTWDEENNYSYDLIKKYKNKIVAIGETGLDFYHKEVSLDIQEISFRRQCQLSKELNLPIIIHCRDAFEETYQILKEEKPPKGVMHCYTGTSEFADKFWDLGLYISWSGCLTFKKSENLRLEAQKIPLERCLIETDAPFLAPQKHRGQRNEPSYVCEVLQTLSQIHNVSTSVVESITDSNAKDLFNLTNNRNL